jgi:hypothetical protein
LASSKISRCIITSTPNGQNKFHDIYIGGLEGNNEFKAIRVDWWQVPGRDEAWKQKEIGNLGSEELFNQEYGNQFLSSSSLLLGSNELKKIKRGAEEESPDEGESSGEDEADESSETSEKRVKILTIHAAKGLESRFVFLMNTNTSKSGRDNVGVLMSWLPGNNAPDHISPTFSAKPKDPAREFLRDQEEQISQIENWNLLYVALTRAKESVYISGSANKGDSKSETAIAKNSWYDRMSRAGVKEMPDEPELPTVFVDQNSVSPSTDIELSFADFNVLWRGKPNTNIRFNEELVSVEQQNMIDLGVAFHAVMEHAMRAGMTDSSDCRMCEAGSFSTASGAVSQETCNWCQPGTYQSATGVQSDEMCILCGPGTYQSGLGMIDSKGCLLCGPGTYSLSIAASSSSVCICADQGNFKQVGG